MHLKITPSLAGKLGAIVHGARALLASDPDEPMENETLQELVEDSEVSEWVSANAHIIEPHR